METLEQFITLPTGVEGSPRGSGSCDGCGRFIWSDGGYQIPGLAGIHCSIQCVEIHLFGTGHCRWCGAKMEKTYTGIDSRLCSEDCSENYYAHVAPSKSDCTAALGTGKRLILWLQKNQPRVYHQLCTREATGEHLPTGKPGRPTINAHTMSVAERAREYRRRNRAARASRNPVFTGNRPITPEGNFVTV